MSRRLTMPIYYIIEGEQDSMKKAQAIADLCESNTQTVIKLLRTKYENAPITDLEATAVVNALHDLEELLGLNGSASRGNKL